MKKIIYETIDINDESLVEVDPEILKNMKAKLKEAADNTQDVSRMENQRDRKIMQKVLESYYYYKGDTIKTKETAAAFLYRDYRKKDTKIITVDNDARIHYYLFWETATLDDIHAAITLMFRGDSEFFAIENLGFNNFEINTSDDAEENLMTESEFYQMQEED